MAARLPSHRHPHQDHGRINVTCSQSWLLAVNDNICGHLEDFMEGHSSNPVAKQLISMPCGLVKVFMCIYNYSFTFLPGHPQT